MKPKADLDAELAAALEGLDPEQYAWVIGQIREMLADVQADLLLAEALGPGYERMDPRAWRPSCPPPGEGGAA